MMTLYEISIIQIWQFLFFIYISSFNLFFTRGYSHLHKISPYKKILQFWNCRKTAVTAVDCGILDAVIAE
jgi:hypothetical protein